MVKKQKRTSVICNDRIAYTDKMDDATAGRFFKTLLSVRNQRVVEIPPDLVFIMAHIQSFWDEVDAEWEKKSELQREKANKRRGKSDPHTDLPPPAPPSDATASHSIPLNANNTDECLTDTVTDTVTSTKKRKSKKKEKITQEKIRFGDFVLLTQNEHTKLLQIFGGKRLTQEIEKLNNYIGSKGRKYKSHYFTIRKRNEDFILKQKNKESQKISCEPQSAGDLDPIIN